MNDYSFDFNSWIMSMMPNIHSNKSLPQELKDAWIELALVINIEHLYESKD